MLANLVANRAAARTWSACSGLVGCVVLLALAAAPVRAQARPAEPGAPPSGPDSLVVHAAARADTGGTAAVGYRACGAALGRRLGADWIALFEPARVADGGLRGTAHGPGPASRPFRCVRAAADPHSRERAARAEPESRQP